jgi:two-component system, cell cycle response regulator DivK
MDDSVKTILVVEDYDDTRLLLEEWLKVRNFRVIQARDGWEAIDLAVREHPSLILMDINIPVIDGIEVTCMLKEIQTIKDVPIVALTGNDSAETREDAADVGVDAFLTKPLDFIRLESVINQLLLH